MGLAYLIIYGGFAAGVLFFLILVGVLFKKGHRFLAIPLVIAGLLFGTYPAIISKVEGRATSQRVADLTYAPETITMEGKSVLFIGGSTICESEICGYAIRHGGLKTTYWTSANLSVYDMEDNENAFDTITRLHEFYEIGMTDPTQDNIGMSLPEHACKETSWTGMNTCSPDHHPGIPHNRDSLPTPGNEIKSIPHHGRSQTTSWASGACGPRPKTHCRAPCW